MPADVALRAGKDAKSKILKRLRNLRNQETNKAKEVAQGRVRHTGDAALRYVVAQHHPSHIPLPAHLRLRARLLVRQMLCAWPWLTPITDRHRPQGAREGGRH